MYGRKEGLTVNIYRTSEVAKIVGLHPNTVRRYEEWGLIPQAEREENGYRRFTDFHIAMIQLAQTAFQVEVLQKGLRKKMVGVIQSAAKKDFEQASQLADDYLQQIQKEQQQAREAITAVEALLSGKNEQLKPMKRKETADYLAITVDALRNWELNGLLLVKRRDNNYRIYTAEDINRLRIIRILRNANYSLEAILRLLNTIDNPLPAAAITGLLNTPAADEEIISVCDTLIDSLELAEKNAKLVKKKLQEMNRTFN
ncbi:MerR family transcriptional regulator [Enterococcus sp. LJL128]|uniref:MerR family transcriptional regulator n=1 Tax=Enterococcus sp. LJL51 TaxID=3416656 RepID=UPI003CF70143